MSLDDKIYQILDDFDEGHFGYDITGLQNAITAIKALIEQRERMAWEAAREEDVDTMGYLDPEEWEREYTYPEFDDWKKEPQSFDPAQDEEEHLAKIKRVVEGEE